MKRKILSVLVVLALVLGMSLATAAPAAAHLSLATSYVNPTGTDDDTHGTGTGTAAFKTIKYAVSNTSSNGTIDVAAGTYIEPQIGIENNLTIVGADESTTIINPSADTGAAGHTANLANGWFAVSPGYTFNLSNVTLDGTGHLMGAGVLYDQASGTVNNCTLENIQYQPSTTYLGMGIAAYNGGVDNTTPTAITNVNVTNCTFSGIGRIGIYFYAAAGELTGTISNNTYTGKGAGNFLDYFVDIEGGTVTISNNTVTGCLGVASDGSTSAGINVATYRNLGTTATITGNTVSNCSYGINVGIPNEINSTGTSDYSTVTANNNNLAGNIYGFASLTVAAVDATGNWWGTAVESGIQALISGAVTYTPWLTSAPSTVTLTADGQAAVAPTVSTSLATAVAFTLATLNGNLASKGTADSVSVSFGYGTTSQSTPSAYPTWTSPVSVTTIGNFAAAIPSGLTPGVTYYFVARAQGNDVSNPVYGSEMSFKTAKITTLAATGIGAYTATLNGQLDIGSATSVIVSFAYGTSSAYGTPATVTTSPMTGSGDFSFAILKTANLTLKGTYHFQALGAIGSDTGSGVDMQFALVPVIGISVSPTSIDFGSIIAGHSSATKTVTVTNTGDYTQNFTATLANETTTDFYKNNLKINNGAVSAWLPAPVTTLNTTTPSLVLSLPIGTTAGTKTATIIFWAQSTP